MALQTSGTITLNDLRNEFGGDRSLDDYYRGGGNVPNISQNNNVPTSGEIRLSHFYGATDGIPLRIDVIGGGGGGGGGAEDGNPGGRAGNGGDSWVRNPDSTNVVFCEGGLGGANGDSGGVNGQGGEQSAFGRGGGNRNQRQNGLDAPADRWGAGGGGAGGDVDSGKNDSQGNGGEGGEAGDRLVGTYAASPGTVSVRVGAGGNRGDSTWDGGRGAGGRVRIRDGRDGDRTFTDGNRRRTRNFNYRVT